MTTDTVSTTLASWNDTPARQAIVDFVSRVADEGGPDYVPPPERIAVFDNDGTLWCEKPMQVELGFILNRLAEMAGTDPELRERQPWKAAYYRDYAWFGRRHHQALPRRRGRREGAHGWHPAGLRGVCQSRITVTQPTRSWTGKSPHAGARAARLRLPADDRAAALPGGERIHELHRFGWRPRFHAAGDRGDLRHSVRTRDRQLERISATRRTRLAGRSCISRNSTRSTTAQPSPCGSGAAPDGGRSSRAGTPTGTSRCSTTRAAVSGLRLLLLHDDPEREFEYTAGAEKSLERADQDGWTVVSIKNDWSTVFADSGG